MLLAGLIVVGVSGYMGVNRLTASAPTQDIQLFDVTRRSFPVLLQEKGELKAASTITVRSELEGRSTIIYLVPEGTHVKTGDLLVELASNEIDDKIRDAEIKVATAKAAYEAAEKEFQILKDKNISDIRKAEVTLWLAEQAKEKYVKGDAVQLLNTDQLALEKAKYVLERAQEKLKDSEELYSKGYITRIEKQNDEFEEYQARLELAKAELALKITKDYTIRMAEQEMQSAVDEATKELARTRTSAQAAEAKSAADVAAKESEYRLNSDKLAKLLDQKKKSRILAPADGMVVYYQESSWRRSEEEIKAGQQVFERQALIELPDTSSMKVEINVHEAKAERLKLGLPATVEIEGFSRKVFTGKVSKIAVLASSRNRWLNPNLREYETEILLDGTFTQLKPGVTARAQIRVADLENVLAVPVQCVFGKRGRYYVFKDQGGEVQPVEVRPGLSSNEYAEIKKGLTEGDAVRMVITDEMKLMLPEGDQPDEDVAESPRGPRSGAPAVEPSSSAPAGVDADRSERRRQRGGSSDSGGTSRSEEHRPGAERGDGSASRPSEESARRPTTLPGS